MASDGTMNESLLKNLDKTLQNMNDKLTTMANSISQVGQNWSVAAKTAAEFTEQIRAIGRAQNELQTTKYNDLFGLDAAKVKMSELYAEIKKLKGDLKSGTEGAVKWNAKSGDYKYVKGDKELSPEDQISKQERLNGLKKIAADLDKGQAQAAIDLLNANAKQQKAEEAALRSNIKLLQDYIQQRERLKVQVKAETNSDGRVSKRGQELQRELDNYKKLVEMQVKEVNKMRLDGIKLSQQEELTLATKHQAALRKIREDADKERSMKGSRKAYTDTMRNAKNEREQLKKTNEEILPLLERRKQIEEELAKPRPRAASLGIKGGTKGLQEELDKTNQKVNELLLSLASLGKRGQASMQRLRDTGLLKKNEVIDNKTDREFINLLRERQRLEERNLRLGYQKDNREFAGINLPAIDKKQAAIVADNAERIKKIDEELNKRRQQISEQTNAAIEKLERDHQARMLEIRRQGEMTGERILSNRSKRDEADQKRAEAEYNRLVKERIKEEKREEEAARRESRRRVKESAEAFIQDEKNKEKERAKALRDQINNYNKITALKRQQASIQASINKNGGVATNEQIGAQRALRQEIKRVINDILNLNSKYAGLRTEAMRATGANHWVSAARDADKLKRSLQNVNNQLKGINSGVGSILPTIQNLASAFGVAFSIQGLVQFGKKIVEVTGQFEMQQVALRQIVADNDAATRIWNQTMKQALQSPFTAMQLTRYTKQLAAYRIENEKLFDTTKRLADVSAGLGVDMGRLILAYGQVKTANYLRASEVRQFTEAGVNIYGKLAEYFTEIEGRAISTSEVVERVSKRLVSFADMEEIFKRFTDEGGEFFDMQRIQSETVRGQIQKLHDAYDQMLNTIGTANKGTIRSLTDAALDLVRNWREVAHVIEVCAPFLALFLLRMRLMKTEMFQTVSAAITLEGVQKRIAGKRFIDYIYAAASGFARLRTGMSKASLQAAASSIKYKVLTKELQILTTAAKVAGRALSTFVPFLAIEAVILLFSKLTAASRAIKQLNDDLSDIKSKNFNEAVDSVESFDDLITRYNTLSAGTLERAEIISKLNTVYGKYLGFQITEATTLDEIANARDRVVKGIHEEARVRALEASEQKVQEYYLGQEQKILKGNFEYGMSAGPMFRVSKSDVQRFREYANHEIKNLSDEEVKMLDSNSKELQEATNRWVQSFFSLPDEYKANSQFRELMDVLMEQEQRIREANSSLTDEFDGLTLKQQESIRKINASYDNTLKQLARAPKGAIVTLPDVKFEVPANLVENSGIWEVIKKQINESRQEQIIQIKLKAGVISEKQAQELREKGKRLGDIFADSVNEAIKDDILKSNNITESYDELEKKLGGRLEGEIEDVEKVNDALELIQSSTIKESDIVNGIDIYRKNILGTLEQQRRVIDENNKKQELGETIDEKLVEKAKKRYHYLLMIAKLLGVETSAKDEVDEYASINLSVGDAGKKAAIEALEKKFGKKTNDYGKILGTLDITTNLNDAADAYHKQGENLKQLIANQEKALTVETNLSEATKKEREETIKQLKVEKEMADFLATYFGYVDTKKKGGGKKGEKDSINKMIELLKTMNSEYEKLSKTAYGHAASMDKVRESYRDAFKEIFKAKGKIGNEQLDDALTMIGFNKIDLSNKNGVAKALEALRDYFDKNKLWDKFEKDAREQLEKAIGTLKADADIDVQVNLRQRFAEEMEELFSDYQMTVDLDKLRVPHDWAADMFDFEPKTLADIRKKMEGFYDEQAGKKDEKGRSLFDEEDLKTYMNYAKKIDAEIYKERMENAKRYSKFLEVEYSERAKLEMQYASDVAFVKTNFSDPTQQQDILKRLETNYNKAIKDLVWKSFTESDFYVTMMDDIASIPADYMSMMMDKLNEIISNPDATTARGLKDAIKARQSLIDAQISIAPIKTMTGSLKEIRAAMKEMDANWFTIKGKIGDKISATAKELADVEEQLAQKKLLQGTIADLEKAEEALNAAVDASGMGKNVSADAVSDEIDRLKDLKKSSDNELERVRQKLDLSKEEANLDEIERNSLNDTRIVLEKKSKELEIQIGLLQARLDVQKKWDQYVKDSEEDTEHGRNIKSAFEARATGRTSASVGIEVSETEEKKDKTAKEMTRLKKMQKALANYTNGWKQWNSYVNDAITKAGAAGNAFYEMWEATGHETNAATEGIKEFGNTLVSIVTESLTMIPLMVEAFVSAETAINAAMGIIGLIAEAIQLVMTLITALARLHDSRIQKELDDSKERVDELTKAYDRLTKAIKRTLNTSSYIGNYNQQLANLNEQLAEANAQERAAQDLKDADKRKEEIEGAKSAREEIIEQIDEIKQALREDFGGIGEDNYRSWTEGFVTAWRDAFLETGDGLDALEDHFDEFLKDWFVKQATMRIAGNALKPLMERIDRAVDADGNVYYEELQSVKAQAAKILPKLSQELTDFAGSWGLEGNGSLSGLAAGIQGITEEQANVLESYWNSVRMYTASIDMNVAAIASALGIGDGAGANPMLSQLQLIAGNTRSINTLLSSVVKSGHNLGGVGIKVFNN